MIFSPESVAHHNYDLWDEQWSKDDILTLNDWWIFLSPPLWFVCAPTGTDPITDSLLQVL
jgi:hypothetical protein